MHVKYEDFCENPQAVYQQIAKKFEEQGCVLEAPYRGAEKFDIRNAWRLSEEERAQIRSISRTFGV